MATRQAATNDTIQLKLDGTFHKLNVTVRHNIGIEQGQLVSLVKSTIGLWCKAWQATQNGFRDWTMASPCESLLIESSADDPYVTVWNKGNGQSLTVHSNTNGATAILPFFAYKDAIEAMVDAAPEMFSLLQSASTPNNVTPMPQQQQTQSQAPVFKAWSRPTIEGLAPNLLGIESGKTDSPNYDKQAIVATVPYHYKDIQFDKKYSFAAFPISGKVVVKEFDGALSIGIETTMNSTIWVKNRGGENDYDWMAITKKLSIEDAVLSDGMEGTIKADYAVMKLSTKEDAQWKNFYGFFNAPEQQTPELAATGTEGKAASDSQWLAQNEVSSEPDYTDIPF